MEKTMTDAKRVTELEKRKKQLEKSTSKGYFVFLIAMLALIYIVDELTSNISSSIQPEVITDFFVMRQGIDFNIGLSNLALMSLPANIIILILPFYKALADRLGRRLFLFINTIGMGMGLLICMVAPSIYVYIVGLLVIKFFIPNDVQVMYTLRLHKMLPMQAVQLQFSLVSRQTEQTLQTLHDAGIGTMAYGALGSGILTGAYRTKPEFGPGDMRSSFYHFFEEPTFSKVQGLLKIMDEIAGKYDVPLSQVALNWVAGCPFVDTAIVGASKVSHAEQCAGAFAWQLSEEDHRLLSQASMETLG